MVLLRVTSWLTNWLLSHLLLPLLAANILVINHILSVWRRIIITLVSCVCKVFGGLVHASLVLVVLSFLLLLASHQRPLNWWVLWASYSSLTLWIYLSHYNHIIFLKVLLIIEILVYIIIVIPFDWIFLLISLIRANSRVFGLLRHVLDLISRERTSHSFMWVSSVRHDTPGDKQAIFVWVLDSLTCCKEHRVDVVEMHLLQLRKVGLVATYFLIWHVFHRIIALCSFGHRAILYPHERPKTSHAPHRPHHTLIINHLMLIILMILHHLVPIFSSCVPTRNASNILADSHIEILLLLIILVTLGLVSYLAIVGQIGDGLPDLALGRVWRVDAPHVVLKALLLLVLGQLPWLVWAENVFWRVLLLGAFGVHFYGGAHCAIS